MPQIEQNTSVLDVWLASLLEDFDEKEVPSPTKVQNILKKAKEATGANIKEYIGQGDNGIVFLSDKNTVLKYTIDAGEATLWGMLKTKPHSGIAQSFGSWQIGNTIVYLVHVEYLPNQLRATEADQIKEANQAAKENAKKLIKNKSEWPATHTGQLVRAYATGGLNNVAGALKHLWDLGVRIYDLQPENFKKSKMGDIKIVDPSVPSLPTGIKPPSRIAFENKLQMAFYVDRIII